MSFGEDDDMTTEEWSFHDATLKEAQKTKAYFKSACRESNYTSKLVEKLSQIRLLAEKPVRQKIYDTLKIEHRVTHVFIEAANQIHEIETVFNELFKIAEFEQSQSRSEYHLYYMERLDVIDIEIEKVFGQHDNYLFELNDRCPDPYQRQDDTEVRISFINFRKQSSSAIYNDLKNTVWNFGICPDPLLGGRYKGYRWLKKYINSKLKELRSLSQVLFPDRAARLFFQMTVRYFPGQEKELKKLLFENILPDSKLNFMGKNKYDLPNLLAQMTVPGGDYHESCFISAERDQLKKVDY